jgi:hypothetical protein
VEASRGTTAEVVGVLDHGYRLVQAAMNHASIVSTTIHTAVEPERL